MIFQVDVKRWHVFYHASVSVTQDLFSPGRHRLPYDLCLIGYESIAIVITTDVTPLVFRYHCTTLFMFFFNWKIAEDIGDTRNY